MNLETKGKGVRSVLDFWKQAYLCDYIPYGESKIKFITGKAGSGKTHALNEMLKDAKNLGYKTVSFSAEDIYLNDFKDIYVEIIKQVDIMECLDLCTDAILRGLGKDPSVIPEGRTAIDYYTSTGEMSVILRNEFREALTDMFLKNKNMDHYFAQVCALIVGRDLGLYSMDNDSVRLLVGWMHASREVKVSALKPIGVSPARITKLNARHMLRSLCEIIRISGAKGLFVAIDDLDILLRREGNGTVKYAKIKRDDTYESIRQLIDDIDTLHNVMFVFVFDREMMENEKAGLKSYQALWMRIQNEIHSERFNYFADIADLDRLANSDYSDAYSDDYVLSLADGFAEEARRSGIMPEAIERDDIPRLREQAHNGAKGLPSLIRDKVFGGSDDE